jgi:hypothetical protein
MSGNLEGARMLYERAMEIDPHHDRSVVRCGLVFMKMVSPSPTLLF